MKILKKNQLVILTIALMLITAGYLNYTDNRVNTEDTIETAMRVAELGDATLVSSEAILDDSTISEEQEQEIVNRDEEASIETATEPEETYFLTSKLERENMYSQMLETYQEIYNNTESSTEQKNEAISEISKINKTKNAIMIAENLINTKGIENIVIFSNEGSISVVTDKDLTEEDIAQIQNIVTRELNVNVDSIHISTKK